MHCWQTWTCETIKVVSLLSLVLCCCLPKEAQCVLCNSATHQHVNPYQFATLKHLKSRFFITSFSSFPQICRALDRKKEFTPAVLYQPLSREVQGLRSLEQYQKSEEDHGRVDELRQMGLTAQEIE